MPPAFAPLTQISRLFAALSDPAVPAEALGAFLTEDYRQTVNGESFGRAAALAHFHSLKSRLRALRIEIRAQISEGRTAATRHQALAIKNDGSRLAFEVIAFYHFAPDGRLCAVEELTRQQAGDAADRDFGRIGAS